MRTAALFLGGCGVLAAWLLWRIFAGQIAVPPDGTSIAVRMSLALAWLLPAAGLLLAMQLVQMAARFIGHVFDPLAGQESPFLSVNQRVITNTVEQMTVFGPALLALAAGASGAMMPQVLALPAVFVVARIAFWAGYLVAPIGRGFGMAATLTATAGAWCGAVWVWSG